MFSQLELMDESSTMNNQKEMFFYLTNFKNHKCNSEHDLIHAKDMSQTKTLV